MKNFWYKITSIDYFNGTEETYAYYKNGNSVKKYNFRKIPYSYKIQKIPEKYMNHLEHIVKNKDNKIIASFKYLNDAEYLCKTTKGNKKIVKNDMPIQLNLFDKYPLE